MAIDRHYTRAEIRALTGLEISTIYRRIRAGTFPPPVQTGPRRVAWRESDIAKWQRSLKIGVRTSSSPGGDA